MGREKPRLSQRNKARLNPSPESSDSEEGAVGGAPVGKSGGEPSTREEKELEEKREKVPKPIVLQGDATFVKLRSSKFVGLKERKIELRINRVRLAQRKEGSMYGLLGYWVIGRG